MHDPSLFPFKEPVLPTLSRRWVLLLALAVAGGLSAYAFALGRPPRYEARAVLGVSIDYSVTESLELVVEDRVLDRVGGYLVGDAVLLDVLHRLPEPVREGHGWNQPADLRTFVRLDRRLAQWGLVAVLDDPVLAAEVAQRWAEASLAALDEASAHAWRAAALMGLKFDVSCLPSTPSAAAPAPSPWDCRIEPPLTDPAQIEGDLNLELALTHGVLPDLTYELLQSAEPPQAPVVWNRAPLILAGCVVGLLAGAAYLILWPSRPAAEARRSSKGGG